MTSIFDLFQLVLSNVWLYGGTFVIVLSLLVFVHEWGHYKVARLFGVKVETFSIGFGKEIWGFNDRHGTRWKLSMIPLGGYVKMFGDADPASAGQTEEVKEGQEPPRPMTEEERKVAFFSQPLWQRAAIVFAGPGINFLFAIILLTGLYVFNGKMVTPPIAAAIMVGSAADEAGFQPHDKFLSVNGEKVTRFEDIRRIVAVALDTPLTFKLLREGQEIELVATPQKLEEESNFGFKSSRGQLGVIGPSNGFALKNINSVNGADTQNADAVRQAVLSGMGQDMTISLDRGEAVETYRMRPLAELNQDLRDETAAGYNALVASPQGEEDVIQYGPLGALVAATQETWVVTATTFQALGQMITGTRSAQELGGIIRIGAIAGDMAKAGIFALITFTALLSINLGLINLFPIPTLDGGHLLFYAVEAVKGSPLSEKVQEYSFRFGLVILVGIMLFANLNDVLQLIQ